VANITLFIAKKTVQRYKVCKRTYFKESHWWDPNCAANYCSLAHYAEILTDDKTMSDLQPARQGGEVQA